MKPISQEVRSTLPGRIARTFFTVWNGYMVLLHGFIKKGKKTPIGELDLARKRCRDVQNGGIER
ncbi:MAG: type II toxin-antitoxin system RelE/ParE family toxin [Spirochaetota bacterium]